jgi:hypothetical protein
MRRCNALQCHPHAVQEKARAQAKEAREQELATHAADAVLSQSRLDRIASSTGGSGDGGAAGSSDSGEASGVPAGCAAELPSLLLGGGEPSSDKETGSERVSASQDVFVPPVEPEPISAADIQVSHLVGILPQAHPWRVTSHDACHHRTCTFCSPACHSHASPQWKSRTPRGRCALSCSTVGCTTRLHLQHLCSHGGPLQPRGASAA